MAVVKKVFLLSFMACLFLKAESGFAGRLKNADPQVKTCLDSACTFDMEVRWEKAMTCSDGFTAYQLELNSDTNELQAAPTAYHPADYDTNVQDGKVYSPDNCITADGVTRDVITIDGTFPGTTYVVQAGSTVAVRVTNNLWFEGLTLHWHGIHMEGTPWSDGVPYLTQCPITSKQTYTYVFKAWPPGTHWYHSHFSNQRMDGAYGFIYVVKGQPQVPQSFMFVTEWFPSDARYIETANPMDFPHAGSGQYMTHLNDRDWSQDGIQHTIMTYYSALIGGRGRGVFPDGSSEALKHPLQVYDVFATDISDDSYGWNDEKGHSFHICNAGLDYTWVMSIDGHRMLLLEKDGYEMVEAEYDEIWVHPGDRVHVLVIPDDDNPSGTYWIRARTPRAGKGPTVDPAATPVPDVPRETLAILSYDGAWEANNKEDPTTTPRDCSAQGGCKMFNCFYEDLDGENERFCMNLNNPAVSSNDADTVKKYVGGAEPDEELFINIGFQMGPSINAKKFVMPKVPAYQPEFGTNIVPCSVCQEGKVCACTQAWGVPSNKIIQLVVSNYEADKARIRPVMTHHPMHLHGAGFAVTAFEFGVRDSNGQIVDFNPDLKCKDSVCSAMEWAEGASPTLNLENPPIMDTVQIPAAGYAVLRFNSSNVGWWLFHCHMESHADAGMIIAFQVGEASEIPKTPEGYPTCSQWSITADEYLSKKGKK